MSYTPVKTTPALSGLSGTPATTIGVGVLVVGAVFGIGYLIYKSAKTEREVRGRIAEKEGSAGLARYEDARTKRAAVEGGLGILSGLAWGGNNGMRRNGRRSSRRRRTSRR
jgi:hypothetical protein